MVNRTSHSTSHDDILDSFLTTIESKLRGPFSSLDLAKAVSTAALRQSSQIGSSNTTADNAKDPAREYLDNLSSVFNRTNKVIQCRMLIGLLGLNDMRTNKNDRSDNNAENDTTNQYLTPEILRILHETQEASHEEWVRTTSGLIEGVMFRSKDGSENGNTRESCRSKEAAKIIRETGTEVCEKVESQIQNVGRPYQHKRKQKQAQSTVEADVGNGSEEKKSAAVANKRNRGFTIEKVKASSSPPAIKKEEQSQLPIKLKEKPVAIGRTEPTPPDLNACFAPYRYRLIPTPVLNTIIPEFELSKEKSSDHGVSNSNCHFQVNASANILQVDLQLEAQRAKDHGTTVAAKSNSNSDDKVKKDPAMANNTRKGTFPPGFRPAKLVRPTGGASGKLGASKASARSSGGSSLFMPKQKRPANLFNTTTKFRPQPGKTMLRRKAGGVQALLKNNATSSSGGAILNKLGSSGGTASATMAASRARPGGVGRFSANRKAARAGVGRTSRMKMIDDDDCDALTKLQQSNAARNMTAAELRASKRKLILEKAAQRGIHGSGGAAAGGTFGNHVRKKQRTSSPTRPGIKQEEGATKATGSTSTQDSEWWQTLLRDRANKISGDDRVRVEKFFTATNAAERSALLSPSEGEPIKRIKIHEERGKDPATGQEIKETFYLELDYDTGASNQSKKVKRYN